MEKFHGININRFPKDRMIINFYFALGSNMTQHSTPFSKI